MDQGENQPPIHRPTFMLSDPNRLMLTQRKGYRNLEPFLHGYVDEYLSDGMYRELAQCFPEEPLLFHYKSEPTAEEKGRCDDFLSRHAGWKTLLDFFESPSFLADIQRFIGADNWNEREAWYPAGENGETTSGEGTPVRVTFKLSWMGRGEWIQPHTDNPQKIISLLLYFVDPEWDASFGGGTEVYEPKRAFLKRNWHNVDLPFEWMTRRHTLDFVPNRLVYLLKTHNSWHGVSPLACPPGMRRKSLLVTFRHERQMESPLQARIYQFVKFRAMRRIEARMRKWTNE